MDLNKPFFVFDTSFGKIVIEYYHYDRDYHLLKGLNDVSTNTYQQFLLYTTALNDITKDIYAKINDPNYPYISSPDNHHFTMSGWHINGTFINKIDHIKTVRTLLKHYLDHEYDYKSLSIFHRMVIAEIVEKYIPEEILKNPKKFDIMLGLKTWYEEE